MQHVQYLSKFYCGIQSCYFLILKYCNNYRDPATLCTRSLTQYNLDDVLWDLLSFRLILAHTGTPLLNQLWDILL